MQPRPFIRTSGFTPAGFRRESDARQRRTPEGFLRHRGALYGALHDEKIYARLARP